MVAQWRIPVSQSSFPSAQEGTDSQADARDSTYCQNTERPN